MDSGEAMNKYSSQYEATLDPFAAFGAKEKQRKYTQLSGPDKATLVLVWIITRLCLELLYSLLIEELLCNLPLPSLLVLL